MCRPKVLFVHRAIGGLGDKIRIDSILRFLQDSKICVHEAILPSFSLTYLKNKGFRDLFSSSIPFKGIRPYDFRFRRLLTQYAGLNVARNFLSRYSSKVDFDVILSETSLVGWLCLEIAQRTAKPLITDVHGLIGAEAKGSNDRSWYIKRRLEAEAFQGSDHILVVTHSMKDYLIDQKISPDKIHVICNGAYPQETRANFRSPMNVIYAGSLTYWEKVEDYLDMAKKVNCEGFRFYLAGSGPLKRHILRRIKQEHIPVKYVGYVPRPIMLRMFAKMQIGFAASTHDIARLVAFPIKILDYMSCGLPVVASNVGDWGKAICEEDCGIALDDDSVDNYVQALSALKDKSMWCSKSDNGIRAIRTRFNWNRVLSPLEDLVRNSTG